MWKLQLRSLLNLFSLLLLFSSVSAQGSRTSGRRWRTLSGGAPLVIARGGFSGIFPDSSFFAYTTAVQLSSPNVHIWCDVQLTRDGAGVCLPDIRLENTSDIDTVYGNRRSTYILNGVRTQGWFSLDFTLSDLKRVNLKQRIYSRPPNFDSGSNPILPVEDMVNQVKPPKLWLNVPYAAFFSQHNLSMRSYIISVSRSVIVNYISSPEVGFLTSIASWFRRGPTKLVLQVLGPDELEPSTNQSYAILLSNLTFIKTFASGIIVPKNYIWPVDNSLYLQDHTPLVMDAHRAGLEVFASNFANDAILPYNYSYDPVTEYLGFIDNNIFSVDGVISDYPVTPSAAIDCFSHMNGNDTVQAKALVISSEGASGDYPGCTDRAYEKAISDGVDILDCPVQMTSDGIPFCLGSINLIDRTDTHQLNYLPTDNPDLNIQGGIFAYNLTWSEIQSLRPAIYNPYTNFSIYRNPIARNDGNLTQLSDFLAIANNASSVSGVLITIENAAYLAENQGLGVTDAVLDALNRSGYNNQTDKKVMIRSSDSAVLSRFKSNSNYELVYLIEEDIRDILNSTILEIKKFSDSVVLSKASILPTNKAFLVGDTNLVQILQAFNLKVYVQLFLNEFVSQAWDFYSDPTVEINTYVTYEGIDGVITDFPRTAARYKRNRCLAYKELPAYMTPVGPGALLTIMMPQDLPPAEAPNPILSEDEVAESPLPPVRARPPPTEINGSTGQAQSPTNEQPILVASTILGSITLFLAALVLY